MWNHPFAPPCYKVQGFDVSVHAMLEYMQQVGITNEMPAPYKLACAHWLQTHWHRQAGIDSLTAACWSREARRRQAFLLIVNCQPGGACLWDLQHEAHEGMRRPSTKWSKSCRPTGWHISAIDPKLFSSPINLAFSLCSHGSFIKQGTILGRVHIITCIFPYKMTFVVMPYDVRVILSDLEPHKNPRQVYNISVE